MQKLLFLNIFIFSSLLTIHSAAFAQESNCKPVVSNVFGDIYVRGSPFSIGTSRCNTEGVLKVNVFGEVYCGNSPFSIGKIRNSTGNKGILCRDSFGNFYIRGSMFEVDVSEVINLKN